MCNVKIVSIFVPNENEMFIADIIMSTRHSDIIQWFEDRNCAIKVDRVMDPVRFGWVYNFSAQEVTSEIYFEYQLTWK